MSWRESSDPRCPECGGEIAATASYCMHCEADFDGDRNEDSVLADDEYGQIDSDDQRKMPSTEWDEAKNSTVSPTPLLASQTASRIGKRPPPSPEPSR